MTTSVGQIYLLGHFEIKQGEHGLQDADWSSRKAAVLLQRLAWERRLLKDEAIDFLWPEIDPTSGANRLYQVLYLLRQTLNTTLGPGAAENTFTFADGILTLNKSIWVDAHEFQQLCSPPSSGKQLSVPDMQKALALYRGYFLPAELYSDWTLGPRETLRRLHRRTSLTLAAYYRDEGDYAEAIALLRPLLTFDPADELTHRELMHIYALAGQRHEALRQYQACLEALEVELGLSPDLETEALYTKIVSGDLTPPSTTPAPPRTWTPLTPITIEVAASTPLAGREAEFKTLQTKMQSGWQGRGCFILLAGDAGVGKTRLAHEAVRTAASSQMTVLVGAAYEQEGYLPYQPFIEAFDRYLAEQGQPLERNPITHFKPSGFSDPQQEHSTLFLATANFLQELAARTPVVLLLDDLHAADEASLHLLHYLARQTRSAPIMFLVTYRTDIAITPVSPFGRLLNALYRERLSEVLHVEPISEQAAGQIIDHILDGKAAPALVKAIFEIAEGNPFFIEEIIRAMLKAEQVYRHENRWRLRSETPPRVPLGLRALTRERVQRLGPEVETALTAAAVMGRDFRFEILQAVAGLPDGQLLDALDAALAGHLIEETETGYRFRHSLIRHILYDVLSRSRRTRLHTLTAEAIELVYTGRPERLEPHIEILAFHYDLSDRRERALPYLLRAGRKAAKVYALEVASDYFERALSLMDELGIADPAQRWPILEQLGWWALTLADSPRAVARFEQALALPVPSFAPDVEGREQEWPPDISDRVRMHRAAAVTLITVGEMAAAEQHLRSAMAEINEAGKETSDYAYLLYDVALWHWHRNEYEQAVEVAQQSLEAAQAADDEVGLARAYEVLALAAHSLGNWQQGLSFEKQRAVLTGARLDVTEAFDVHLCLWEYHLYGDKPYDEIKQTVETTLQQARRMGAARAIALCQCFNGALEFQAGHWSAAEAALPESIKLYRQIGAAGGEALACQRLGVLQTAQGRLDEAMTTLAEGIVAGERALLRTHCLVRLYAAMARNRLAAGDIPAADQALALGLAMSQRHGHCSTCNSLLLPVAVSTRVAQGNFAAAEAFCRRLDEAVQQYASRTWVAMAHQSWGELALAQGQLDRALSCYISAYRAYLALGSLYEIARCLTAMANIRLVRHTPGDLEAAQVAQLEAQQIFTRLGAVQPET